MTDFDGAPQLRNGHHVRDASLPDDLPLLGTRWSTVLGDVPLAYRQQRSVSLKDLVAAEASAKKTAHPSFAGRSTTSSGLTRCS